MTKKFFIFKFNENYLFKKILRIDFLNQKSNKPYIINNFMIKKTAQEFEQFNINILRNLKHQFLHR
ncbi:hypothetical protein OA86_10050 [Kaistella jeonii]|uniref:Uncharacterized protein n=1 Tax=Kaistella jeonii TaxID=266749 RepID=A0A0C1F9Y4_9FLAO|nr:hypothetical protein OA86_10050 [Kaistella jeonii]